jgi:cyclase
MLAKRIIPCLDVKDGRTVKGTNFVDLRDAGDPVLLAKIYADQGADELVFLDITATHEKRKTLTALVDKVAHQINIPFTVGGGISSIEDVRVLLDCGADKISINTAAYKEPDLIEEMAMSFGSQCVVVAIDIKRHDDGEWYVYLNGGRLSTTSKAVDWAINAVEKGAGEILLTSMDHDGTKAGFALDITSQISSLVSVPVIASGGGGLPIHFYDVLNGCADAALAASVFHFGEISIPMLKEYLRGQSIPIR